MFIHFVWDMRFYLNLLEFGGNGICMLFNVLPQL